MRTATLPKYPNRWRRPDERFEGLLKIANAINTAFDMGNGDAWLVAESEFNPSTYPVLNPLRLARLMREAADRIAEFTEQPD